MRVSKISSQILVLSYVPGGAYILGSTPAHPPIHMQREVLFVKLI